LALPGRYLWMARASLRGAQEQARRGQVMRTQHRRSDVSSFLRNPVSIAVALAFAQGASAAVFTVTNANESGAGSFYQAVSDANANCATNGDTAPVIQFSGPFTISPCTTLPTFFCGGSAAYNPTIDG